jgi:hypothetical protein
MATIFSLDLLSAVGLGATLALEYAWHSARFSPDHAMVPLAWCIGFAAVFTIFPFLFHRPFAAKTVPWATAALAAPLHFFLVYDVIRTAYPNDMPGLVPAAFAVPSLIGLILLLKAHPRRAQRETRSWRYLAVLRCFSSRLFFQFSSIGNGSLLAGRSKASLSAGCSNGCRIRDCVSWELPCWWLHLCDSL